MNRTVRGRRVLAQEQARIEHEQIARQLERVHKKNRTTALLKWFIRVIDVLAVLASAGVLALAPVVMRADFRAALGHGLHGTFVSQSQECNRAGCYWTGTFTTDTGMVTTHATWGGALPAGDQAGSQVPAIYEASDGGAYAVSGSMQWLRDASLFVIVTVILGVYIYRGPVRYLRERKHMRRALEES